MLHWSAGVSGRDKRFGLSTLSLGGNAKKCDKTYSRPMVDDRHTWAVKEPSEVPRRTLSRPITTPRSPMARPPVSVFHVPRRRSNDPEDAEKPPPVRLDPAVPAYTSYNVTI